MAAISAIHAAPLPSANKSHLGGAPLGADGTPLVLRSTSSSYYSRDNSQEIVYITHMVGEAIIAIVSVFTNGLVLLAVAREPRLRTPTNYFVTSLAMADFLVGVVGIPCAMVALSDIHNGFEVCLLMNSAIVLLTQISIFGLLGIAMERFAAIQYPFAYQRHCGGRLVFCIVTVTWLAALLIGVVPLFGWNRRDTYNGSCSFAGVMDTKYMVYFIFFGCVLLPLFLIFGIYSYIFHIVRCQVKQIVSLQVTSRDTDAVSPRRLAFFKEMRAAKAFGILIVFFTLCWMPLHIMNAVSFFFGYSCRYCYIAAILLSHANSAFNPILYAYANVKFKTAIKKILHCNGASIWDSCEQSSNGKCEYPAGLFIMRSQPLRVPSSNKSTTSRTSSSLSLRTVNRHCFLRTKPQQRMRGHSTKM